MKVTFLVIFGAILVSCSDKNPAQLNQIKRVDSYLNSDNEDIAEIFFDRDMLVYDVQPALTKREFYMLDELVENIEPEVRSEFDRKFFIWLICWLPLDSIPDEYGDIRKSLKCNGQEFKELIDFCNNQGDEIFLLFYQLAARASCPYDRLLLHPVYDLLNNFPEFNTYCQEVDILLEKEKPNLKNRTCNESTIWYIRKILESKYGVTYLSQLNPVRPRLTTGYTSQ